MANSLLTSDVVFEKETSTNTTDTDIPWGLSVFEGLAGAARTAGAFLAFTVAPLVNITTTGPDPWDPDRRRFASSIFGQRARPFRRKLTILEARKLALDILMKAEAGRAQQAEYEARKMAEWDVFG